MGTVYEGVNIETNEPAAIKILSASLAHELDFRQRFEGEIETLRMLRHPNIVRLFGFGEQDEWLYYAMELVDGNSLEQELRDGRRFSWREVAQITIDLCKALRHAHDRGVIHRDIKPANLLLASNGQVKLSDFGIARLFGNTRLTSAGNVLGTVEYMAPEQADARPVGPRADLYSLGGVMYALLTGRAPFRAKSLAEMLDKQRTARPEPVTRYAQDVPAELEGIISQLLEKDPDARISNAMILVRRLEALVRALSQPGESEEEAQKDVEYGFDLSAPTVDSPPAEISEVAATRMAESGVSPPATEVHPQAAEELAPTRETAAFKAFAGHPETAGDAAKATKPDRFVAIQDEELGRIHDESESESRALISLHTWVLAAALISMGLTAWYLLTPPTADALYDTITTKIDDDTVASYLQAEGDIREFLTRYSNDSRSKQLREYMGEIDLTRLERKFELRAGGVVAAEALTPIEVDYLEAIKQARLSPEKGIVKLQALIDLHQPRAGKSGPTGQCLELARRRLKQLREQVQQTTADHLSLIRDRLAEADQLDATDPARARKMREAVVELYDGKPWAAEAVHYAREMLSRKAGGKR
jgi:serine/threonine-protein kinase